MHSLLASHRDRGGRRTLATIHSPSLPIPAAILTFITVLSVLGALVLAGIMLLNQVQREAIQAQWTKQLETREMNMRRLRWWKDNPHKGCKRDAIVSPPDLKQGKTWHLFLSHAWGAGQDAVRVIKLRMQEMIPGVRVFLDVDNLESVDAIESYIDQSEVVLIYCSQSYFNSRNCMRELIRSVSQRKRLIALFEPKIQYARQRA